MPPVLSIPYSDPERFLKDLDTRFPTQGLKIRTQLSLTLGERIQIEFRIQNFSRVVKAQGDVAWISQETTPEGKKTILIRNIRVDPESESAIEVLRSTGVVEEITPEQVLPPSPPPSPPSSVPPSVSPEEKTPSSTKKNRKILWVSLGLFGGIVIGTGIWLYWGGIAWIQANFLPPPEFSPIPPPPVLYPAPEPPLPSPLLPPPPPPKPSLPVFLNDFEYFQRTDKNEFILYFNRPPKEILPSRAQEPLGYSFFFPKVRLQLEKEQYFFGFTLIKSVLFEEEEGGVKVTFYPANPQYIPDPVWENRGREIYISFPHKD